MRGRVALVPLLRESDSACGHDQGTVAHRWRDFAMQIAPVAHLEWHGARVGAQHKA
jgi:hypothetical protein